MTGLFPETADGRTRTADARTPACLAATLDRIADPQLLAKMSVGATDLVRRLFDPDRFLADILAD